MSLLDQVKELKSEYNIGTSNAFYYLKSLNHWNAVRSELGIDAKIEDISNAAFALFGLVLDAFEDVSSLQSLEKHQAIKPTYLKNFNPNIKDERKEYLDELNLTPEIWEFDYKPVLKEFFANNSETNDLSGVAYIFLRNVRNNKPLFVHDNKRYGFQDLLKSKVSLTIPEEKLQPDELDDERQEAASILRNKINLLSSENTVVNNHNYSEISPDQSEFLFRSFDLYERLKRERVLERREYQQLYARLIIQKRPFAKTLSVEDHIINIQENHELMQRNRAQRYERLLETKTPKFIMEREENLMIDAEEKHRYAIRVIRNNKKYLEEVLELPR